MNTATHTISVALANAGLLNPVTWTKIVKGIDGEDYLLAKWREVAQEVDMGIERLSHGETRCWPIAAS